MAVAPVQAEVEYRCDCAGFRSLVLEQMCLKCLEAYTGGLPHVLKEPQLGREMRRVAGCLARILKNDPLLGNLPLGAVLRAAERN